jgi:tRNA A37 methylthiotransferase MiaB
MKVYLESLGCIRRYSEIVKLQKYLALNDIKIVNRPKNADCIILSTCAFKEDEENYSLTRLRHLKKFGRKLLVLGCLPDISPSKFSEFDGTPFIPPRELNKIDAFFAENMVKFTDIDETNIIPKNFTASSITTAFQKFRNNFDMSSAFRSRILRYVEKKAKILFRIDAKKFYLNISKGCMGNCSYCAIRRAIGKLASRPTDKITKQLNDGLERGYKDFIILGDDVGAYGIDVKQNFPELMSRLINELIEMTKNSPENKRLADVKFHIQEIHPHWLVRYKQEMLDLIKSKRIKSILCPIESGNDRILDLMNRRYNADEIAGFFQEARSIYPDIKLTTHLMVGFPSETDEEFKDSLRVITKIHFDEVTVFPYDPKEGTPASEITPQLDKQTILRRLHEAQDVFKNAGIKTYTSCPN